MALPHQHHLRTITLLLREFLEVRCTWLICGTLAWCMGLVGAASSSEHVARLCHEGRYGAAERLARDIVATHERHLHHPHHAASLHNLAVTRLAQGDTAEAEHLCHRALTIDRAHAAQPHPDAATTLMTLAAICRYDGRLDEAKTHLAEALRISLRHHGPNHRWTAAVLVNLAEVLDAQGIHDDATRLHDLAIKIFTDSLSDGGDVPPDDGLHAPLIRHHGV